MDGARHTLRGHSKCITSVAISADGRCVVTGSADSTARVWDAQRAEARHVLEGHGDSVRGVAISPDG
eukprot:11051032-Alexandrium_andersonii.AAC.1